MPADDVGREDGADDRVAIGMLVEEGTSSKPKSGWSASASHGSAFRDREYRNGSSQYKVTFKTILRTFAKAGRQPYASSTW